MQLVSMILKLAEQLVMIYIRIVIALIKLLAGLVMDLCRSWQASRPVSTPRPARRRRRR
jgi:hypothetical protein